MGYGEMGIVYDPEQRLLARLAAEYPTTAAVESHGALRCFRFYDEADHHWKRMVTLAADCLIPLVIMDLGCGTYYQLDCYDGNDTCVVTFCPYSRTVDRPKFEAFFRDRLHCDWLADPVLLHGPPTPDLVPGLV